MEVFLLTVAVIAIVMLAMAVGVILRGRCLSGSCGGPKVTGTDGSIVCGACGRQEEPPPGPPVHQIDFSGK